MTQGLCVQEPCAAEKAWGDGSAVACLLFKHEDLAADHRPSQSLDMVVLACDPSSGEAEAGERLQLTG